MIPLIYRHIYAGILFKSTCICIMNLFIGLEFELQIELLVFRQRLRLDFNRLYCFYSMLSKRELYLISFWYWNSDYIKYFAIGILMENFYTYFDGKYLFLTLVGAKSIGNLIFYSFSVEVYVGKVHSLRVKLRQLKSGLFLFLKVDFFYRLHSVYDIESTDLSAFRSYVSSEKLLQFHRIREFSVESESIKLVRLLNKTNNKNTN